MAGRNSVLATRLLKCPVTRRSSRHRIGAETTCQKPYFVNLRAHLRGFRRWALTIRSSRTCFAPPTTWQNPTRFRRLGYARRLNLRCQRAYECYRFS